MNITFFDIFLNYLFEVVGGVLIFLAIGHILFQKRSSTSIISWLLAIILLPHIAVPLYFFFGIRKRKSSLDKRFINFTRNGIYNRYEINIPKFPLVRLLEKGGIPSATTHNDFELITSGVKAYQYMLDEIQNAKESIDICTYVFKFDNMTASLLDALTKKAIDGVRVRILIDLVGSMSTVFQRKRFSSLIDAGGEVLFFRPFTLKPFQNYINLRNHRKIYIFDRQRVLSGGMNLSNEYMGKDDNSERWEDILFLLRGPSVDHFYTIFHNDWCDALGKELEIEFNESKEYTGKDIVQVIPSGPDISVDALYLSLLNLICMAKERIWIVTPYFVPNDTMMEALIVAANKNIDVKLITPKRSNHIIADLVRTPYLRELEDEGVDILLYEGEMLHAKTILFDEDVGMVGSANFDNRSLFLNYEVVSFIYSNSQIEALEFWIKGLMRHCSKEIKKPSKLREAAENIMKVFSAVI